jgi:8-oxo-dGTP pyrophosphatase MutT (NUDIX family)
MLQKRSKYKKFGPNQLGLTGGHVMGDDSLEKTLFKEVEEEIGVDLRMLKKPVYINCVRP